MSVPSAEHISDKKRLDILFREFKNNPKWCCDSYRVYQAILGKVEPPFHIYVDRWPDYSFLAICRGASTPKNDVHVHVNYRCDVTYLAEALTTDPFLEPWVRPDPETHDKVFLTGIAPEDFNTCLEYFQKSGFRTEYHDDVYESATLVNEQLLFSRTIPDDVTVSPLKRDGPYIPQIGVHWSLDVPLDQIINYIDNFSSLGIFVQEELVAYAFITDYGGIGKIYVDPQHRLKGYGALLMSILCKELKSMGFTPLVYIYARNVESQNFHRKIGFEVKYGSGRQWLKLW